MIILFKNLIYRTFQIDSFLNRRMIFIDHNNPFYKIKILDYTYTCQPSINTALPLRKSIIKTVFFVLGCIISVGFLWLVTKWSSKNKAILLYSVCSLTAATQFLIEQQDLKGGTCIVKRQDRYDLKKKSQAIAFTYHERTYLYKEQKQSFYPIRFEQLGIYLDRLRKNVFMPYSEQQRKQLQSYYGENAIRLPVKSKFQVFLHQMLTPYQVFQTYGIIVWIYEQYYFFAFLLLFYSLITYWLSSRQITENQRKLAEQSYFETQCKVLQKTNEFDEIRQKKKLKVNSEFNAKSLERVGKKTHDFEVFCDEITTPHVQIDSDSGTSKHLINQLGIDTKKISSHELVPGDLLILQQGDIVPCDCILIKGQILANEQYTTGQSYPVRKVQLSDFIYAIEKQKSFMLTLGTRILKIKSNEKGIKRRLMDSYAQNSLERSMACDKYTQENQIICLVTDTNYNTHRGKYLRAIRYQKKQQQTFTIQTIYFIYILLAITTIVFAIIYSRIFHHVHIWAAVVIYFDLLFTCIPPTLPTALSVGISFAQLRLSSYGINCVVPDCILTGGRVNTIVLQGYRALGKKYQIDSVIVGIKQDRALGRVYTSFKQFAEEDNNNTLNDLNKTEKYLQTKRQLGKIGQMFFNALASCHTLEMFEGQLQGQEEQKQLFNFSQSYFLDEDKFQNNKNQISVGKRIYFRIKDNKMAVAATIQKDHRENGFYPDRSHNQRSLMDQMYQSPSLQLQKLDGPDGPKKVIFMKGPPEKILNICNTQTFPKNSFQYIVDMAEKGFLVLAYAYRQFPYSEILGNEKEILQTYRTDYTFLGYAVLKQKRSKENEDAIQLMKKANLNILLVSEERELETNSIALLNNIYTKNELLLCSMNKEKTQAYCRGYLEWDSSGQDPAYQLGKQLLNMKKQSNFSITAPLYEQLFMRREQNQELEQLFNKFKVYSQMLQKHQRNLYYQLEKKNKITFAVGGGGNLSQCANVSLELQRKQSSLLSSFYSQDQSLLSVVHCLRICRAGLSTNFHCFNMMILFSIVQFTTLSILEYHFQVITDGQSLYLDLFVTFPIFITLNMTLPSNKLSKQIPEGSFFTLRALATTIGQSLIQLVAQGLFFYYLLQFPLFEMQKKQSQHYFRNNKDFMDSTLTTTSIFILSNYLYLGIVLSTSVSKPFRKPFYTNPYYTINLILLWIYNTIIVAYPPLVPKSLRIQNTTSQQQFILTLALIFGNLVMLLMYMYENLLVWIWQVIEKRAQSKKQEANCVKIH